MLSILLSLLITGPTSQASLPISPEHSIQVAQDSRPKKRRVRKRKLRRKPQPKRKAVQEQQESRSESQYPQLRFDFGVAAGSYGESSYTEAHFGINTYFKNWMVWRNALFGRFASEQDTVYGIDTSLRGIYAVGAQRLGFTAFAGPGYRLVSQGNSAFFVEGGAIFKFPFGTIGGGAKIIQVPGSSPGAPDTDTTYFLILSGGGAL